MSNLEQLLDKFQQHAGISEKITLPHTLIFDDSLQVNCSENKSTALLTGEVINMNEVAEGTSLLHSLMQLNLVRMYDRQAILCLDQSSAGVELFRRFEPAGTDVELFNQYLEDFINELEFWQDNARMLCQKNHTVQQNNFTFLVP
jgi:hypothetical protein